jgi:hypothetical protein
MVELENTLTMNKDKALLNTKLAKEGDREADKAV